jgi:hypothetical protein
MDEQESQLGFDLGEQPMASGYSPNLSHVREDLQGILAEARSALDSPPWDLRTYRYKKIVFLQMAKWLPDDEAQQMCFQFAQEMERIEALLAA